MRRLTAALCVAGALTAVGACSSDDDAPAPTTIAPTPETASADGGLTPLQIRVMAQEQIGRSINGVDYECDMPTSTEPGTEFNCQGETGGHELRVIATINPDGTVTLTMLD